MHLLDNAEATRPDRNDKRVCPTRNSAVVARPSGPMNHASLEGHASCSPSLPAVAHKEMVRRFVNEAVNRGREEIIDDLFTDEMTNRGRPGGAWPCQRPRGRAVQPELHSRVRVHAWHLSRAINLFAGQRARTPDRKRTYPELLRS